MKIIHTDGRHNDFIELCKALDDNLDEIVGGEIQRQQYVQYNQLDDIHDVVLVYIDGKAAACGSFKVFNKSSAEIKRVFVHKAFRRKGIAVVLMTELEKKAREAGYERLILETGTMLEAAMHLYNSMGFQQIKNYGPYTDMPESFCMEKQLN